MRKDWRSLLPALVLAAGIIAATALSLVWAWAGPILLAATLIGVGSMQRGTHRMQSYVTFFLGCVVFAAGALIAVVDPKYVAVMMPILGSCAAVALPPRECAKRMANG